MTRGARFLNEKIKILEDKIEILEKRIKDRDMEIQLYKQREDEYDEILDFYKRKLES